MRKEPPKISVPATKNQMVPQSGQQRHNVANPDSSHSKPQSPSPKRLRQRRAYASNRGNQALRPAMTIHSRQGGLKTRITQKTVHQLIGFGETHPITFAQAPSIAQPPLTHP